MMKRITALLLMVMMLLTLLPFSALAETAEAGETDTEVSAPADPGTETEMTEEQ